MLDAPAAAPRRRLVRRAASGTAATMASRVLGVVRESVLASLFGPGNEMDAFRIAFRIPNILRDLFAEGAMSAAFVPAFTRRLTTEGHAAALRLGLSVTNALLVITGALMVLGIVFARPLILPFVTADYAAIPGQIELTVLLTRILMPYLAFIAVAAAAMAMLNALHHFFLPALSSAVFNVVSITVMMLLVPVMPQAGLPAITAIAIATVAGGFAQWAMQLPPLRKEGFRYRPVIDWRDEGLRRMLLMMAPGTFGLAATQVNLLVSSYLASSQSGVVSTLEWAFRLMYLPIGLFGVSIAAAALPAVSRQSTADDVAGIRSTVVDSLSLMMTLNVPATVGLMVLATPIVRVIYEHGAFTARDTAFTAVALQMYAIGLVGYSVVRLVSPVFYALDANRQPVIVSVLTVLLNAALSVLFVLETPLSFSGLPLATSIAALFNAGTLMYLLHRRLSGIEARRLTTALARIALASALMGAAAFGVNRVLAPALPDGQFVPDALRLAGSIGCGIGVLALSAHILRIREFEMAVAALRRRFSPASP